MYQVRLIRERMLDEKLYNEILELANYCQEIGVKFKIMRNFDGFQLVFNKGDVIQHCGSYGCNNGCVEFGCIDEFKDFNYRATPIKKAKKFVLEHKEYLNCEVKDENI